MRFPTRLRRDLEVHAPPPQPCPPPPPLRTLASVLDHRTLQSQLFTAGTTQAATGRCRKRASRGIITGGTTPLPRRQAATAAPLTTATITGARRPPRLHTTAQGVKGGTEIPAAGGMGSSSNTPRCRRPPAPLPAPRQAGSRRPRRWGGGGARSAGEGRSAGGVVCSFGYVVCSLASFRGPLAAWVYMSSLEFFRLVCFFNRFILFCGFGFWGRAAHRSGLRNGGMEKEARLSTGWPAQMHPAQPFCCSPGVPLICSLHALPHETFNLIIVGAGRRQVMPIRWATLPLTTHVYVCEAYAESTPLTTTILGFVLARTKVFFLCFTSL